MVGYNDKKLKKNEKKFLLSNRNIINSYLVNNMQRMEKTMK